MTPRSLAEPARRAGLHVLRGEDDTRLADLCRTGNDAAFEAIVERYRPSLVRFAAGIVGADCADEAVQESLICAHRALRGGQEVLNVRAWLYRIVRNKSLNLVRDRGPAGVPLDERHAALDTPDAVLERHQALDRVVAAVQDLPVRQRDAIVLRELEGRSYDEIAGRLGMTDPAVRGLLNRARVTLRRAAAALGPFWPGRVAELWQAGSVSGSAVTRACATCLVAAVATVGGVKPESAPPDAEPARERASVHPSPPRDPAATATAGDRTVAPPMAGATVQSRAPAASPRAAATEPPTEPAPDEAPASEPPPEREGEPPAEPRREREGEHRGGERGDEPYRREPVETAYRPPPEDRDGDYRMQTADTRDPATLDFHKTRVGDGDGDRQTREFSRYPGS